MTASATAAAHAGRDFSVYSEQYMRDGVVLIKGALNATEMSLVESAFNWRVSNPSRGARIETPAPGGRFQTDSGYAINVPIFRRLFETTGVADIAAGVFGSPAEPVWYLGEQVFVKEWESASAPGTPTPRLRTFWHQDSPHHAFDGSKIAALWIPLSAVPKEAGLEVIRGSHRGPLYSGTTFTNKDDPTEPLFLDSGLPRLPNIEAERDKWPISSWPMERGDVLVFHTASLHGGGETGPGFSRRSLTLRFAGNDVLRSERPRKVNPATTRKVVLDERGAEEGTITAQNTRIQELALGEPIYKSDVISQVRPWVDAAPVVKKN